MFDTLYLVVGISIFGLPEISSEWYANKVYVYILPFGYGLAHIGRVGSVFITVSVTIERYLAIVHPLQHFRGKKYLLYVPTIATVVYNIPKFFEHELKVKIIIFKITFLGFHSLKITKKMEDAVSHYIFFAESLRCSWS